MDIAALGRAIASNHTLKVLYLDCFAIDTDGIKSLCDGLFRSETL